MGYQGLKIKEWAMEDRPREKMIRKGIGSLSDAELIAILIGSGTREHSALELSRIMLKSVNNRLDELARMSMTELQKIKGIGQVRAVMIKAALELGRRRREQDPEIKVKISTSKDAFDLFGPKLEDLPHEQFWVMLLNRSNIVMELIMTSSGGVSGTVIDTRMVLKPAIEKLASGIILCHNHPSGNRMPSEADTRITRKIREAAQLVDINLLDHIIVARGGYYSFADEGIL